VLSTRSRFDLDLISIPSRFGFDSRWSSRGALDSLSIRFRDPRNSLSCLSRFAPSRFAFESLPIRPHVALDSRWIRSRFSRFPLCCSRFALDSLSTRSRFALDSLSNVSQFDLDSMPGGSKLALDSVPFHSQFAVDWLLFDLARVVFQSFSLDSRLGLDSLWIRPRFARYSLSILSRALLDLLCIRSGVALD
jgi:hypothetical protein